MRRRIEPPNRSFFFRKMQSSGRWVFHPRNLLRHPETPMAKLNALYAQSGGVTAVINATAAGVIETARRHRNRMGKVFAAHNGILGALREELFDTSRETAAAIAALRHTAGGAFGTCRYKLKGIQEDRAEYERGETNGRKD